MSEYAPPVRQALAEFVADLELAQRHGTALTYGRSLVPLARLELDNVALLTSTVCRQLLTERAGALGARSEELARREQTRVGLGERLFGD